MKKIVILIALAAPLAACGHRPVAIVSTPPAQCGKLIPQSWRNGVEAPPVPENAPITDLIGKPLTPEIAARIAAPWANGYVAASGAIDKANGRTTDTIDIIGECERQANAARPK